MKFTDELREATKDSWNQSLQHPFVQGIVRGDLPLEMFKNYIMQDIYYLNHYAKVHALAAAQAEDFALTALLADTARDTAETELVVHQEHAKILNITDEEMENFKPAPTAYAYTSHLYRSTMYGNVAYVIAAMLPCYWLYADIGRINREARPNQEIYRKWLATYADDWFQESTQTQINLLNELAAEMTEKQREKLKELFIIGKEYELSFWEMSYTFETWISERASAENEKEPNLL